MSEIDFDPERDVLEDVERIINYAAERRDIAKISLGSIVTGVASVVIGVGEMTIEGEQAIGSLTCSFGVLAFMLGGLGWGFNEFRHTLRMSGIN